MHRVGVSLDRSRRLLDVRISGGGWPRSARTGGRQGVQIHRLRRVLVAVLAGWIVIVSSGCPGSFRWTARGPAFWGQCGYRGGAERSSKIGQRVKALGKIKSFPKPNGPMDTLTWLHLSDIHFRPSNEWRDQVARQGLLKFLKQTFCKKPELRPDVVFCTGDIAFGETRAEPLAVQYAKAEAFFTEVLRICAREGVPLARERLFVVPGNHDINREVINSDAQARLVEFAAGSNKYQSEMNQRIATRSKEFLEAMRRLDDYGKFVARFLPHQSDTSGRHCYAAVVEHIGGIRLGIAGFNSAWTCAGEEDDRTIWLPAEWQFNHMLQALDDCDLRIGLVHHPVDWFNTHDRSLATRRISAEFHFWLHGHTHDAWVTPASSHITVAAGAVGAYASEEFGANIVRLDLARGCGEVHLCTRKAGEQGWIVCPVGTHAPDGTWPFSLPNSLKERLSERRLVTDEVKPGRPGESKLFGRNKLLDEASGKLGKAPFLLVFGMRGNGKSELISALAKRPPLVGRECLRIAMSSTTAVDDFFRQVAVLLGDASENPKAPVGDVDAIATEIRRRYPNAREAWLWLDRAHLMLKGDEFRSPQLRNLLLGLQQALGLRWHWIFEFRERPPHYLLGSLAESCEVPGLDKESLQACLAAHAPEGREAEWNYKGDQLKRLYQWLGGGHGEQAHPQATRLLIQVANGRNETPRQVLERHLGDFEQKVEDVLLDDLFNNVLEEREKKLLKALSLYRTAVPHDHADRLEEGLEVVGAWDALYRRCLLSPGVRHQEYYLHSFIAAWLRTRQLGYGGHGEEEDLEFAGAHPPPDQELARTLHGVIAECWLHQLNGSKRISDVNISRALEAFHHLVLSGLSDRLQDIASDLLADKMVWAQLRIEALYDHLHKINAPTTVLRQALEYAIILNPNDHKAHRFLGECWVKEEGRHSTKALKCFERAHLLYPEFPPYLANMGKVMLSQGGAQARRFLAHLGKVEQECPDAVNDHVRAIQADCLRLCGGKANARDLRMREINAGSQDSIFYNDEAKALKESGDLPGALDILDLAERNGAVDSFSVAIRSQILDEIDPVQASVLRMKEIEAGSREAVFYVLEAKARSRGDRRRALEILDLAEKNGAVDKTMEALRVKLRQGVG